MKDIPRIIVAVTLGLMVGAAVISPPAPPPPPPRRARPLSPPSLLPLPFLLPLSFPWSSFSRASGAAPCFVVPWWRRPGRARAQRRRALRARGHPWGDRTRHRALRASAGGRGDPRGGDGERRSLGGLRRGARRAAVSRRRRLRDLPLRQHARGARDGHRRGPRVRRPRPRSPSPPRGGAIAAQPESETRCTRPHARSVAVGRAPRAPEHPVRRAHTRNDGADPPARSTSASASTAWATPSSRRRSSRSSRGRASRSSRARRGPTASSRPRSRSSPGTPETRRRGSGRTSLQSKRDGPPRPGPRAAPPR